MSKRLLTKESVLKALEASKATSISSLYRAMGGGASIPGSTAKRIRELVPDVGERLTANKCGKAEAREPAGKRVKGATTVPSAEGKATVFRPGSAYQKAYEILATHPDGLSRQELLKKFMAATGKDEKHSRYDIAVVLSASESPTGPRHRSCRPGFWVEKENDFLKLHTAK